MVDSDDDLPPVDEYVYAEMVADSVLGLAAEALEVEPIVTKGEDWHVEGTRSSLEAMREYGVSLGVKIVRG